MVRVNSNELITLRNQPYLRGHKYVINKLRSVAIGLRVYVCLCVYARMNVYSVYTDILRQSHIVFCCDL